MFQGISIIVAVIVVLLVSFVPTVSYSAGLPFGGIILTAFPCTCSPGITIVVGPPTPAILLYVPGASLLFRNFKPTPGSWTLGTYTPGASCWMFYGKFCAPSIIFPFGTITKFGTS